MEEIWKDVVGYEGLYKVSNLGRVKSVERLVMTKGGAKRNVREKILKKCFNKRYFHVALYDKGKRQLQLLHRLVASAFIENPNMLPQVNHIDGNKLNNCVDNLEWCDQKYNNSHAFLIGLKKPNVTHFRGVVAYKFDDDSFVGKFKSQHEASRELGVNVAHICSVLKGRCKKTSGYYFKYNGIEKKQNIYEN